MNNDKKYNLLKESIGPFNRYSDGFGNPGTSGKGYILGPTISIGKVKSGLLHEGSKMLDEINAFDKAETDEAFLGQINMSYVSSFCGLNGLIWGYDIVRPVDLFKPLSLLDNSPFDIPIYDITPLRTAMTVLLGTVDNKHFPFLPGAHVACAGKNIKTHNKGYIFSAIAIAIPEDRKRNAVLLMEDIGEFSARNEVEENSIKLNIINKMTKSVFEIGKNQRVEYKEIFVGLKDIWVDDDETGCCLVAAPYFVMAKKAIPKGDVSNLIEYDLNSWVTESAPEFLINNNDDTEL